MFIAAVHVYVKPDKVDEFIEGIKANHEGSIAEPGCLRFDVARSKEDPTEFLLWEVYVDEAANAFHKTTPHYLAFKEQMPELMSKERHSDLFDGIYIDSEKLP
ncbi:MAG: antibiotic biosynthesis monooxygenase [Candidatus Limnocylindrales bacterium]